jgi:hypothetical protein
MVSAAALSQQALTLSNASMPALAGARSDLSMAIDGTILCHDARGVRRCEGSPPLQRSITEVQGSANGIFRELQCTHRMRELIHNESWIGRGDLPIAGRPTINPRRIGGAWGILTVRHPDSNRPKSNPCSEPPLLAVKKNPRSWRSAGWLFRRLVF